MTERFFEEMPIFIQRLVADSGGNITGGADHFGMVAVIWATRSVTTCRAFSKSVPGLKIILIDESWATLLERMTSSSGTPFSACSNGIVTSSSTSSADRPSEGV